LWAQVEVLASLRSPKVVMFMGAAFGPDKLGVVMELCARGSLYDLLEAQRRPGAVPLSWSRRMQLALDIATGMNYLVRSCAETLITQKLCSFPEMQPKASPVSARAGTSGTRSHV
jgi:hypothetical protein